MIAVVDVHYTDDGSATVVAVVFADFGDPEAVRAYRRTVTCTEGYVPGQFYRRELPCILSVLAEIQEEIDTVIIDGYVDLGNKPGLGRHLWEALDRQKRVIGVAKRYFNGSKPVKTFRCGSRRPLYVTAVGIKLTAAADLIAHMHGRHRLPTLLKEADSLSRLPERPGTAVTSRVQKPTARPKT